MGTRIWKSDSEPGRIRPGAEAHTIGMVAHLPQDQLAAFCQKWRIKELALFGSAVRGEQRPDSDIDLLYTLEPGARWSLFDLPRMERELESILGRRVDFVSRAAVEESPNWYRRQHILSSVRTIYAA